MFDGDDAGYKGMKKARIKISQRYPWNKIETYTLKDGKDPDDLTLGDLKSMIGENK